jgi:large subunit ribosomal protein L17
MRKLVTALIRIERIEGIASYLDESRGYAERLIQEAVKHGDVHQATMELADYWLLEKDLIHKLFNVLVPRYSECEGAYTQFWNLPTIYPGRPIKHAVLELKGNPWPPVVPHLRDIKGSLINILLDETRHDYRWRRC